jgi:anti-sigma regulatory factor (Ser/Thr protein kinase)
MAQTERPGGWPASPPLGGGTGTMHRTGQLSRPGGGPGQASARVPVPPARAGQYAPAAEWPLQDFTEFPALPSVVWCARIHAQRVLSEWGLASLHEPVGLVVSELVTNSVLASQEMRLVGPVRLWLLSGSAQILVLVADASPRPPVPVDPGTGTETGRGLLLVQGVSDCWNWYPVAEPGIAKVVWAEFWTASGAAGPRSPVTAA